MILLHKGILAAHPISIIIPKKWPINFIYVLICAKFIMSEVETMINLLRVHSKSHQGRILAFFPSTVFLESAYLTKTFLGLIKFLL